MPISGAVVLLALLFASSTSALRPNTTLDPCQGFSITARQFAPVAEKTWALVRWERAKPKAATIAAERHALQCAAGPGHRKQIYRTWKRERLRFGRYRELRRIAPYSGGGTYWAIPYAIVYCESGGSWSAFNPSGAVGPYQLLGHGAPYPANTWREKMANHRIAAEIYAGGAGASAWVCA